MIQYYHINGNLVKASEASLKVSDLATIRGYGVFDYFQVREGVPMFIDDYVARFANSAKHLYLDLPISPAQLKERIQEVIEANGLSEAGIRLLLTGGYSDDGFTPTDPNLLIMAHEIPPFKPETYDKGGYLLIHQFQREVPEAKTINYLTGIRLIGEMKKQGAIEVLYHDGQFIRETARGNFFLVTKDNRIVTAHEKILAGITRKNVLHVAKEHFTIDMRDIKLEELQTAKEAFITSSNKGVLPIVKIGDLTIGDGKPGNVTQKIGDLLEKYAAYYIENQRVKI